MPTARFNDAELYLLRNWVDASRLEESMNEVRRKYLKTVEEVLDEVQSRYKELDLPALHIAGRKDKDNDGIVAIGKKKWPLGWGSENWPTSLALQSIGLLNLLSDEEDAPEAIVTIYAGREGGVDAERAQRKLTEAAEKLFGKNEFRWTAGTGTEGRKERYAYIVYPLTEPRQALRKLLLEEPGEFVDHLVAHFDAMAGFIPVIDDIVSNQVKRSGRCT